MSASAAGVPLRWPLYSTSSRLEGGFAITSIALRTEAKIPGIDAAKFESIAQQTKQQCLVSKALAGTEISLDAKLG